MQLRHSCEDCNGSGQMDYGSCGYCDGQGTWEMSDLEQDARLLGARSDVAHAEVVDEMLEVTDADGNIGRFVSVSEAISWLVGADEHLVGLAVCACATCCPYVGPR